MKSKLVFVVLFLSGFNLIAQQKLTVEEIYSGAFRTETMDELFAMKNSNQYTVLNFDRSSRSMQLDLYDFATLQKINTIVDTKNFPELANGIDSFVFSKDEKQLLIANNTNAIFRYSFTADYFLYNLASKKVVFKAFSACLVKWRLFFLLSSSIVGADGFSNSSFFLTNSKSI